MPTSALIAGGLGAAGSLGSAFLGSQASKSASQAQVALGQQALALQQQLGTQGLNALMSMFNTAQGIATPIIQAGGNVLNQGQGILTGATDTLKSLLTPGANMTATLSQIPGFQFAQDWGQKAVQNLGTTTGLGGNVLKAGADYATGVAQQGFGSIVNALQSLGSLGSNVLGTGAGLMAGPAESLISGATSTGQSAFGGLNQLASTVGGTLGGIGSATAAGTLGSANALSSGLTGAAGAISTPITLSALLSRMGNTGGAGGGGGGVYSGGASY